MMLRNLGSSALLLVALFASSTIADSDIHFRGDIHVSAKPLPDRTVFVVEEQVVEFPIVGELSSLNVGCAERGALVTSKDVQVVVFHAALGYQFNQYQGYAGIDSNDSLIPFVGSYNVEMWNNYPSFPMYEDKSGLGESDEKAQGEPNFPCLENQRMLARMRPQLLETDAERAVPSRLPNSIVRFRRPLLESRIVAEYERQIEQSGLGEEDLESSEFKESMIKNFSPLFNQAVQPLIAECFEPIPEVGPFKGDEAHAHAASVLRSSFTQDTVFDSRRGDMYVYNPETDTIGVARNLNRDLINIGTKKIGCAEIDWCRCSVRSGCIRVGPIDKRSGDRSLPNAYLTKMELCQHGDRAVLALAYTDGRIYIYDPHLCGVLNVIERRCRCTRMLVYPVWMKWCSNTNRLIVQYRKTSPIIVGEAEIEEISDESPEETEARIHAHRIANGQVLAIDEPRVNEYFVNVYKFDDLAQFAGEPVLEYTIKACKIRFVRYCCGSSYLYVVVQDGDNTVLMIYDRNFNVIATCTTSENVELFEVSGCGSKHGPDCTAYMVSSPSVSVDPRDKSQLVEKDHALHIIRLRRVLEQEYLVAYTANAELESRLINIKAHAKGLSLVELGA